MKLLAAVFAVAGAVIAAFQWYQIVYRLHLFFRDYASERGVNHIGDGDFAPGWLREPSFTQSTSLAPESGLTA